MNEQEFINHVKKYAMDHYETKLGETAIFLSITPTRTETLKRLSSLLRRLSRCAMSTHRKFVVRHSEHD